jgi:predicted RNA-binding protein with PIN domain
MSIHIIIDGYNLIRQSNSLRYFDLMDIQLGREALVETLAAYRKLKPHRVTVVFDGAGSLQFSQQQDQRKGITIRFSHNGESADAVIKRMAYRERERALVVSSDRQIINKVTSYGAATIGADDFGEKLTMALYKEGGEIEEIDDLEGWRPTTKKKGPNKRLSKKRRRNKLKIRKL